MASKPLRFHVQAEQEYLTALTWYRGRSPIAAINFESAFGEAVEKIREAPERWPIYFMDFRKYTLRQFPGLEWATRLQSRYAFIAVLIFSSSSRISAAKEGSTERN